MEPKTSVACRLCGGTDKPLQRSHILPKWCYRRATFTGGSGNPNPIWHKNGKIVQTSLQIREKLLCSRCERALSIDEMVVAGVAGSIEGPSPLLQSIPRRFPTLGNVDEKLGFHLMRFGISVFWRAHESSQREFGDFHLPIDLSVAFRDFLLESAPLPVSHPLVVTILDYADDDHFSTLVSLPKGSMVNDSEYWAAFVAGGMIFEFRNGATPEIHDALVRVSLSHGSRPWVFVKPWNYRPGMRQTAREFAEAGLVRRKGVGWKRAPRGQPG